MQRDALALVAAERGLGVWGVPLSPQFWKFF